jgi:uncharacterized protein
LRPHTNSGRRDYNELLAKPLEEIPLFPLHAVLLPHERLQLHVFEERYCQMVNECLDFDRPFGIVMIRQGQETGEVPDPYLVGTTARIDQVHRYPDGRMHISVVGETRFRIRQLREDGLRLWGSVEPVHEEDVREIELLESQTADLVTMFKSLIQGLLARPDFNIDIQLPEDPVMIGFVIARFLCLENSVKQSLIELTDTAQRLELLQPLVREQIKDRNESKIHRIRAEELKEWVSPN